MIVPTRQIKDLLYNVTPENPNDTIWTVTIHDTQVEGNPVIYYYSYFDTISELIYRYGDWSVSWPDVPAGRYTQNNDPYGILAALWTNYIDDNMTNYERIAHTYNMTYNPINNYDRTETESSSASHNRTLSETFDNYNISSTQPSYSTTHTYGNGDVEPGVNSGAVVTTNQATTYNDVGNLVDTTRDITTGSEKTTVTYQSGDAGKSTTTYNGTKTTTDNGDDTMDYRHLNVSGNIGVTTTQQMVQSEIDLRKLDMLHYIIDGFVNHCLVLLPDADDCCRGWYPWW